MLHVCHEKIQELDVCANFVYLTNFVDKISYLEADKGLRHSSQHSVRQFVLYGHIRHFVSKCSMWPGTVPKNVFVTDLKAVEGLPQSNLSRSNIAIKLNSVIATQFGFLIKTMQYSNLCF
jgi:hypothetical protein